MTRGIMVAVAVASVFGGVAQAKKSKAEQVSDFAKLTDQWNKQRAAGPIKAADCVSLAKQFDGLEVKFLRKSGEGDHLFGSVTAGDIAEALEKKSFHIDRRKIQLHESLKSVGEFIIPVKLHKDVTAHLKVVVDKEAAAE